MLVVTAIVSVLDLWRLENFRAQLLQININRDPDAPSLIFSYDGEHNGWYHWDG